MTTWLEDKRKGFNAEAYFAAHAEQITGRPCKRIEALQQIAHNEGDYRIHNDESA